MSYPSRLRIVGAPYTIPGIMWNIPMSQLLCTPPTCGVMQVRSFPIFHLTTRQTEVRSTQVKFQYNIIYQSRKWHPVVITWNVIMNDIMHEYLSMCLLQVSIIWLFYPGSVTLNNVVAFSYNELWPTPATNKFSVTSQMLMHLTTAIYGILQLQELDFG